MAKWVKLTDLDRKTQILLNLALAAWIVAKDEGSRVTFVGGPDGYTDVRETPEQVLSAPQVGW